MELHKMQQDLFDSLPETFTTKEAKQKCVELGKKEQYWFTSLRKKSFKRMFNHLDHGMYSKKQSYEIR